MNTSWLIHALAASPFFAGRVFLASFVTAALARWWERLTVAPNCVNYHLEHHLVPSIPKYHLAAFHRALREKGLLERAEIAKGYGEVVRKLISIPAAQAAT